MVKLRVARWFERRRDPANGAQVWTKPLVSSDQLHHILTDNFTYETERKIGDCGICMGATSVLSHFS